MHPAADLIYIGHSLRSSAEAYCEEHGWIEVPDAGFEDWTKSWPLVVAAVDAHLASEHPQPARPDGA